MANLSTISWISLVPRSLPEHRLSLHTDGVDLRTIVDADDLLPLREVTAHDSERRDLDFAARRFFVNPTRRADFAAGRNCYTYSMITIEPGHIELAENYGDGPGSDLIAVGDRLISRLFTRGIPFRWNAYSFYADSGETSEHREGRDEAFRGG